MVISTQVGTVSPQCTFVCVCVWVHVRIRVVCDSCASCQAGEGESQSKPEQPGFNLWLSFNLKKTKSSGALVFGQVSYVEH